MYTLYTDKSEDFKCDIEVEGANLNETKARLVVESDSHSILFEGKVNSNGECIVPISKMKDILKEGEKGKMKLEVIAEDTFFSPWESDYEVKTNKKVTVEVKQPSSNSLNENQKKKVIVRHIVNETSATETINNLSTADKINSLLEARNISASNLSEIKIKKLVNSYLKANNLNESQEEVIKDFKQVINANR